jgi:hypothetical protein
MAEKPPCPDGEVLATYAAGCLDEAAAQQIRAHLGLCEACASAVRGLRLQRLVETGPASPSTGSWALPSRNDPLDTITGEADRLEDSNFDFTVLEPATCAESLGRLGRYEVLSLLGQGGMGVVLRAFDGQLGRAVALKVLSRHLASSVTARRRFQREARAAAAINHPNVVTIHAVEEHRGLPFLVMELIVGRSLHQRIRTGGPLEPAEVIRLTTQIVEGLAAAHAQNVIHRDIKPANVMVQDKAGLVKITDFGLARILQDNAEVSSHHLVVGTPAFMAPEQVQGQPIDARTDLFSLGSLMYAMLAGHSPFRGRSGLEITHKVVEYQPVPLRDLNPSIPPFLAEVVARLLQKDPRDRFQSTGEVARAIQQGTVPPAAARGESRRGAPPPVSLQRPGRRKLLVLLSAGVALLALVGALLGWRLGVSGEWLAGTLTGPQPSAAEITVAADGRPADFRTISQALAAARPGAVIRILDASTYTETLAFTEPQRLRGVQLIGARPAEKAQRPTLASPDPAAPVIDLHDVSGVHVRGFEVEGPLAHNAIVIHGSVAGAVLEDLHCRCAAQTQSKHPLIVINAAAPPGEATPIRLRRCVVHRPALGQCVKVGGGVGPAQAVCLEENRFSSQGVLVLLWGSNEAPLQDVTIAGNLFLNGLNGVNLNLLKPAEHQKIRIANNTFFRTRHWIGLVASNTEVPGVTLANNLLLGARDIEGDARLVEKALDHWTFRANWWEPDPALPANDPGYLDRAAERKQAIDLLERQDPEHPDFLRPPPASPLFTSGAGGELPTYVGARGPQRTSRADTK